jgi:hypothetical protein
MSWYFLGGFSAYLSVPSGRRKNHSGCSLSHGWSGEQLIARVERDVDAVLVGGGDERAELLVGAELRVDGVVAPGLVADRVGAAGIARLGREGVVAALAVGVADRVDRRHVEDVEAQLGDGRDLLLDAFEAAPGAREELVPGAEARERAVDVDLEVGGQLGGLAALLDGLDELEQRGVQGGVRIGGDGLGGDLEAALVLALGALGRGAQEDGALAELAAQVGLAELDLARKLVAPAGEEVDPRLDVPLGAARLLDRERALPAHAVVVGVDGRQRRLAPAAVASLLPAHHGTQHLVAIAEDVRTDVHRVGHGALDWPTGRSRWSGTGTRSGCG